MKILSKKIKWNPATADDVVGYKVYWSLATDGAPTYNSDSTQTSATQIVIPNEVDSFPLAENDFILGVSSVDDVGNESDITVTSPIPFDFIAPDAPTGVIVESI